MVAIGSLVYMAAMPVIDVFIMSSIGFIITRKGIMDGKVRHALSKILLYVFIPCLTFSKIGTSLNFRDLTIWWILPVNMAYSIGIGLIVGYITAWALNVDPWFRKLEMCVVALGNVGNLPIVLVQSICANEETIFAKALPGQACEEKGIAYVAFSMWVASTFQFCIAIKMMERQTPLANLPDPKSESSTAKSLSAEIAIQMTSPPSPEPEAVKAKNATSEQGLKAFRQTEDAEEEEALSRTAGAWAEREHDSQAIPDLSPSQNEDESELLIEKRREGSLGRIGRPSISAFATESQSALEDRSLRAMLREKSWMFWQLFKSAPWSRYFNMPTIAALAGVSVGCISVLKDFIFGDTAPLGFVSQSITIMSGGMIPCMMLLLGSGLSKGPGNSGLPVRVIVGTSVVRLLVLPGLGYLSVLAVQWTGIFHAPNPLFTLVLMICHCTPTALNLQTVATLNQNGETEIASLICWQYIASLVTVPMWMAIFISTVS